MEVEKTDLEKHEGIVKEKMDDIKKGESKDASGDSSAENQKIEAEKKAAAEKAENDAKAKDAAILAKEEKDLTEEEKTRKAELDKAGKKSKPAIDEEVVNKRKKEIQSEIDALTAQKKTLQEDVAEKAKLQAEIDELKKEKTELAKKDPSVQEKAKDAAIEAEAKRLTKYLDEDKDKPREQKREMSKDDLEEWLLEDMLSAQEWLAKREVRRDKERTAFSKTQGNEKLAREIVKGQAESVARTMKVHPELDNSKRIKELEAESKSGEEMIEILSKENEKYGLCIKIYNENPEKYMYAKDGPEQVVKEMEKRLKAKKPVKDEAKEKEEAETKKKKEQDEKEAKIAEDAAEAERQRKEAVDEGVESTNGKIKPSQIKDFDKRQEALAAKAGISVEELKKLKDRRKGIPGAA